MKLLSQIFKGLILSLVFLFFSSLVNNVSAQNTFNCEYNRDNDTCVGSTSVSSGYTCNPGFGINDSLCSPFNGNESDCLRQVNLACRSTTSTNQRCSCLNGTCTPDPNGPMLCSDCNSPTANAACNSGTNERRFRCTNPQNGCQPCTAGTPGCNLTAADCTTSCTPSASFQRCDTSSYACVTCASPTDAGCVPASECTTACRPPSSGGTDFAAQIGDGCPDNHIRTAIGCFPVGSVNDLAAFILRWGLGAIGGIGFLLIIFASIMIITSTGDPKRLQAGKELLTAALAGIFLLIFSVFILRLIGVNILKLPGLGS